MIEQTTALVNIEDIDQSFLPGGKFDPKSEQHYKLVEEKFRREGGADGLFTDVHFDGLVVQVTPNSEAGQELKECIELLQLGGYNPSIHRLKPLLERYPYNINLLYNYGMALREVGQVEQSIDVLRSATEIDPNHVHAWVALAVSNQTVGNKDDALQAAKQALILDDNDPFVLHTIGFILESTGDLEGAAPYLEKTLLLSPNDPQAHLTLGKIKSATDPTAAKQHFKNAAMHAPGTSLSTLAESLSKDL